MDCRKGTIHNFEDAEQLKAAQEWFEAKESRQLAPLTEKQARTMQGMTNFERKGWMRNQPCVCGSTKKFKLCCWGKYA